MKIFAVFILLLATLFNGCASVKVLPEAVVDGSINLKDNSQTIARNNLAITIAADDTDMVNYNIEGMIASFNVKIENSGESDVTFDKDSFVLVDASGMQYYQITPDKVKEMMAKDTYYLLPYPYVGFYYLEDYELAQYKNATSSNLPYYFELYPQDIYTRALPTDPIIPKARTKGLIYFHADIHSLSAFTLKVYKKSTSKSAPPDFIFPFKVVK